MDIMIKHLNVKHLYKLHPRDIKKATVIAIIYKRNKIISYGFNRKIMSTTELHHTNQIRAYWTKHAERDALNKAGIRSKGCEMLVIRIKKDMSFGNAKPCYNCQFLIEKAEIKLPVHHT
jgi:deoxycytidylate deaminase